MKDVIQFDLDRAYDAEPSIDMNPLKFGSSSISFISLWSTLKVPREALHSHLNLAPSPSDSCL